MYRITGFGEPTDYETLAQAQADIRSMGDEWLDVSLVERTNGGVYNIGDGERWGEHVGDTWASVIYDTYYDHLDDKKFRAKKMQEIQDWMDTGDMYGVTLDDCISEWSEYDALDIEANK